MAYSANINTTRNIANNKINKIQVAGSKGSSAGQSRLKTNFAAVMNQAQESKAAGAENKTQPVVARLPEVNGLPIKSAALAGRSPTDYLRMQNFNKANNDIMASKAIDSFLQTAGLGNGSTLDAARGMSAASNLRNMANDNNLRVLASGGNGKGFALSNNDYIHTRNMARIAKTGRSRSTGNADSANGLGKLSAKFESGSDGIAAIGYDSTGGTSYGKYQIASKVGSMKSFLNFLDQEAPDLAERLRKAGPANTGSRKGAMPNAWRSIAKEQPERFEQLQEAFIHQSHYKPALEAIEQKTGIDTSHLSAAMREVIWSTAVQHGPAGAARIFAKADDLSGKAGDASYERKMINNVYSVRAGQFGSSTNKVRQAVRNRFKEEKQLALQMLETDRPNKSNLAGDGAINAKIAENKRVNSSAA